ncbi:MAG: STAS domain-containing protein [Planctomycetota bacterium]|jgi:anti-sigma B factor antagonist
MAGDLSVEVLPSGNDTCTIMVSGRLDLENYDTLDQAFGDAIDAGWVHICVDLEGIDYISSSGFGIFIEAMGTVQQRGGSLSFVNLSEKAKSIFRILGVMVSACDLES